jgi:hypothetical protein
MQGALVRCIRSSISKRLDGRSLNRSDDLKSEDFRCTATFGLVFIHSHAHAFLFLICRFLGSPEILRGVTVCNKACPIGLIDGSREYNEV